MKKMLFAGVVVMSMVGCLKGYDGWGLWEPVNPLAVDSEGSALPIIQAFLMVKGGQIEGYKFPADAKTTVAYIKAGFAQKKNLLDPNSLLCRRDMTPMLDTELVGPGRVNLFLEPRNDHDKAIMERLSPGTGW